MALHGKLSTPNRYITSRNEEGKAIIDERISTEAPFYEISKDNALFAHCYITKGFPTNIDQGADIAVYQDFLKQPPGLTVSGGTVLRYVDIPPGSLSPMHRTVSLDYGVVLEGEVELVLDSGEARILKRGDIAIQRATMHAWRNMSKTEWARMLYILQPVQPFSVAGDQLTEDYGDIQGVKPSE